MAKEETARTSVEDEEVEPLFSGEGYLAGIREVMRETSINLRGPSRRMKDVRLEAFHDFRSAMDVDCGLATGRTIIPVPELIELAGWFHVAVPKVQEMAQISIRAEERLGFRSYPQLSEAERTEAFIALTKDFAEIAGHLRAHHGNLIINSSQSPVLLLKPDEVAGIVANYPELTGPEMLSAMQQLRREDAIIVKQVVVSRSSMLNPD